MTAIIVLLVITVVLVGVCAPIVIWYVRRNLQEKKNYERALKTVPLLIHLPPASDDIESNGRDTRDIVDETISKAQIIYKHYCQYHAQRFQK